MVDVAYRLLGLLVQARYQIALLVGLLNALSLLLPRLVRGRRERRPLAEGSALLAISPRQLHEVTAGWQYAGLRRYPALRLAHQGDDRAQQVTYLAFDTPADRDAVRARLG